MMGYMNEKAEKTVNLRIQRINEKKVCYFTWIAFSFSAVTSCVYLVDISLVLRDHSDLRESSSCVREDKASCVWSN